MSLGVLVYDLGLFLARSDVDVSYKKRYLVILVERFPKAASKFLDAVRDIYLFRLALKAGERAAIAHVGVDKVAHAVYGVGVGESKSLAAAGVAVGGFQYAHSVVVRAALDVHYARNSGSVVWRVVLVLACAKRLLKGLLFIHQLVDSVGLVAVGNYRLVAKLSNGRVDDKVRVGKLAWVGSFGLYAVSRFGENAVARVHASAHDEVRRYSALAIGRLAYYNASAGVGIAFQLFVNIKSFHIFPPLPRGNTRSRSVLL